MLLKYRLLFLDKMDNTIKARNNVFSVWRFIFQAQTSYGKMHSVVSISFTSEPDLILSMYLSVHKEFNLIKLIDLEIVWMFFLFNEWYNTVLIPGIFSPCSCLSSILFLFLKSEVG